MFTRTQDYSLYACSVLAENEPQPKSSEWGYGLTTCIAAIVGGFFRATPNIVTVSDTKASFGGSYSTEGVMKLEHFHRQWATLIAGDDIGQCDLVIERAKKLLRSKVGGLQVVMDGFKAAYKQQFHSAVEDELLAPFDMTLDQFRRRGKTELNAEVFADLSFQIRNFKLGCKFLVYGFDDKKRPHLFSVDSPGQVTSHDRLGFWAIGSGARSALSMLAALGQTAGVTPLSSTIYNVLAAKYISEGASDVGRQTFLFIKRYGSTMYTNKSGLEATVRRIWESEGRPRTNAKAVEELEKGEFVFYPPSASSALTGSRKD